MPKKSHRRVTKATPTPTKRPRPTRDPAPMATNKPVVESKYKYEIELLNNPEELYNNVAIALYIKTDNPDGTTLYVGAEDGQGNEISSSGEIPIHGFDDVHYNETYCIGSSVDAVQGGYLKILDIDNPGSYYIKVREKINGRWNLVAEREVKLFDYDTKYKEYSEKIIAKAKEEVAEWDSYSEELINNKSNIFINYDGVNYITAMQITESLGEDAARLFCTIFYSVGNNIESNSLLAVQEVIDMPYEAKLARVIGEYIRKNYCYTPNIVTESGEMYTFSFLSQYMLPVWNHNVGLNCWEATYLLEDILKNTGIIQYDYGVDKYNPSHEYGIVIIDGKRYAVDACPKDSTGLISEWTYII